MKKSGNPLKVVTMLTVITLGTQGCALTGSKTKSAPIDIVTEVLSEEPRLNHLAVNIPWELTNPSRTNATINSLRWTFSVDGHNPVQGTEEIGVAVGTNASDSFNTSVEIPLEDSLSVLTTETESTIWKYNLLGTFQIQTENGLEEIESQWYGEFFAPQAPTVSVYASGARYSYGAYQLNFYINVHNPNSFPVKLNEVDYSLTVDKTQIHQGQLGPNKKLAPGSGMEFEISRKIGKTDFMELAKRLQGRNTIPYLFSSTIQTGNLTFAKPVAGELNFE